MTREPWKTGRGGAIDPARGRVEAEPLDRRALVGAHEHQLAAVAREADRPAGPRGRGDGPGLAPRAPRGLVDRHAPQVHRAAAHAREEERAGRRATRRGSSPSSRRSSPRRATGSPVASAGIVQMSRCPLSGSKAPEGDAPAARETSSAGPRRPPCVSWRISPPRRRHHPQLGERVAAPGVLAVCRSRRRSACRRATRRGRGRSR